MTLSKSNEGMREYVIPELLHRSWDTPLDGAKGTQISLNLRRLVV